LIVAKKANVYEKIFVWKENFIPSPKVESSVLLFESHNLYNEVNDEKFLEFIKKAFLNPRKKLINNLWNFGFQKDKLKEVLNKLSFWENVRPEELKIWDYIDFIKELI
jgi:16S rRNA (adenine1518-N6/adenine1519-N6)-dimethyltransferase